MTLQELATTLYAVARIRGYRRKGGLFWKTGEEITTLIELQGSRWGSGIYINVGAIPTRLLKRGVPPRSGYWPLGHRAESFDSRFRSAFERLATEDRSMPPEDVLEPLSWLLDWLDTNVADPQTLRQMMADPGSWAAVYMQDGIMADWFKGELRDWDHYFGNKP